MSESIDIGDRVQLKIDSLASQMAKYDAWSVHEDSRINVVGKVDEGEKVTACITGFEGGSYFGEIEGRRNTAAGENNDTKYDVRGSKNDLVNQPL